MRYRIAPRPSFFSIPECSCSRVTSLPWPMDGSYCATSTTRWQASISNERECSSDGRDDDDD